MLPALHPSGHLCGYLLLLSVALFMMWWANARESATLPPFSVTSISLRCVSLQLSPFLCSLQKLPCSWIPPQILLHLRYHLERASDKNRVIGVILAVLGEMNWNIYSQYITITAHTLTSLVLSYGTHQTWGTNAIDLIRYFHQSCSGPHSRIFLLSRHIAPICRALVAVYTELDESPEEKEGVEALKQQICQLLETILVHSDLQELVKSIDVPGVGQVSRDLFAWKDSQGASYSAVDVSVPRNVELCPSR
jgi:hypothetical protein